MPEILWKVAWFINMAHKDDFVCVCVWCYVPRWIWCFWCYSECPSTPGKGIEPATFGILVQCSVRVCESLVPSIPMRSYDHDIFCVCSMLCTQSQVNMMFLMLLWVYIHTGQDEKLANFSASLVWIHNQSNIRNIMA